TRADVLGRLVFIIGYKRQRYAEAALLGRLAQAAIARAGDRPELHYLLDVGESAIREARGDYTGQLAYAAAELGLATPIAGWPRTAGAAALGEICDAEKYLGRYAEARAACHQSTEMAEAVVGARHPLTATRLHHEAVVAARLGDHDAAAVALTRALEIREAAFGPEHEAVAALLSDLSDARLEQGRLDEAHAAAERAVSILAARGSETRIRWVSEGGLAEIEARLGRFDAALVRLEGAIA